MPQLPQDEDDDDDEEDEEEQQAGDEEAKYKAGMSLVFNHIIIIFTCDLSENSHKANSSREKFKGTLPIQVNHTVGDLALNFSHHIILFFPSFRNSFCVLSHCALFSSLVLRS